MPSATASSRSRTGATTTGRARSSRVASTLGIVTPFGWVLLGFALALFGLGRLAGWTELVIIAVVFAVALVIAIGFSFGTLNLRVDLDLVPQRVVAGERAAAQILVTNVASRRSGAFRMELGVGVGAAEFRVPGLPSGAEHEEVFVLPTFRRAVIPVGPATSVRSDPLGLLRRAITWTDTVPLYVHPPTVRIPEPGVGLLRDLEGRNTNDVSSSDVAFHTLREYQPGDDRRFVHWLSTARTGKLMVRQFIDTRRVHVAVAVDGDRRSYASDDEFDIAVSIAASLGVRTILDEQNISMVAAGTRVPCIAGTGMLDALSGVELGARPAGLGPSLDHLLRTAVGVSLGVLVTGSRAHLADVRSVATLLPVDVRTLLLRAAPGEATSFRPVGSMLALNIGSLEAFPDVLWAVARS